MKNLIFNLQLFDGTPGDPPSGGGGGDSGGGNSTTKPTIRSAAETITSAGTYNNQTYTSTNSDENAVLISTTATVTLNDATVKKSGDTAATGTDADKYTIEAAKDANGNALNTFKIIIDKAKIKVDEYEAAAPSTAAPAPAAEEKPVPAPVKKPSAEQKTAPEAAGESVNAPMPGIIVKVNVANGQAVKAGDVLVVLEAMKMENEIAATTNGTVKSVLATEGLQVATGDPLAVIE